MKNRSLCVLAILLLSGSVLATGQEQEKSPRPIPKMTTDDVSPSAIVTAPEGVAEAGTPTSRNNPDAVPTSISWQTDLARAREIASSNNGVVIVDVYTDWCPWCKKMDQEIYSNPRVAALGAHDVFVKANAEDGSMGETVARRYGVSGFPTTLIMDGDGNLLTSHAGFISPADAFVRFVQAQEGRAR
jgi:thiol:disulfide interchange protein